MLLTNLAATSIQQ